MLNLYLIFLNNVFFLLYFLFQTGPKTTLPKNNSAMMGIATENEKVTSNTNGHVTNESNTTNGIESHE